ncbi:hypothetical protein PoB_005461400 [Plakobranchus ocellatus]|uniref:Uncharacterized protein n=1 Tax=Plakobranchus ocellatus TaxID=259542 RepID=A0AAV4CBN3_9GAST|nr:hypothetical protein PoB_005461400 [Plakobranchus ocellatus]
MGNELTVYFSGIFLLKAGDTAVAGDSGLISNQSNVHFQEVGVSQSGNVTCSRKVQRYVKMNAVNETLDMIADSETENGAIDIHIEPPARA